MEISYGLNEMPVMPQPRRHRTPCSVSHPGRPPASVRATAAAMIGLTAALPGLAQPAAPQGAVSAAQPAFAQDPGPARGVAAPSDTVQIVSRHYDNAVGSSDAASEGVVRAAMIDSRPLQRPGEVLEAVPGLVVTQHAGDGGANPYFLRGFNLDHGTDFATSVDGIPVNMPTNAPGQGHSDLSFLIPELIDQVDYRKGPYLATHGDFADAGSADIEYRRSLDAPLAQLTLGERGYRRLMVPGRATSAVAPSSAPSSS